MPQRTNTFQQLARRIASALHENARVVESAMIWDHDAESEVEVDILVSFEVAGIPYEVGIECRDHRRKSGPSWLRDLKAKRDACRLTRIIAIHSAGFSKPALRAADAYAIKALTLGDATRADWKRVLMDQILVRAVVASFAPGYLEFAAMEGVQNLEFTKLGVQLQPDRFLLMEDLKQQVCQLVQLDWFRRSDSPKPFDGVLKKLDLFEFRFECAPGSVLSDGVRKAAIRFISGIGRLAEQWVTVETHEYRFGEIPVAVGRADVLGKTMDMVLIATGGSIHINVEGGFLSPETSVSSALYPRLIYRLIPEGERSVLFPDRDLAELRDPGSPSGTRAR